MTFLQGFAKYNVEAYNVFDIQQEMLEKNKLSKHHSSEWWWKDIFDYLIQNQNQGLQQ